MDRKWWPGRVVNLSEISASYHSFFVSTYKTPIMLLRRNDKAVEWHKLDISRHIKSFRCGDIDDLIKQTDSSQVCVFTKRVKCAHQEEAILHALQLEKQEAGTMLKRPVNVHQGPICRAKRSGSVPVESFNLVEHLVLHSQPMDDYSLKSTVAENISSEATISDFSGRGIQSSERIIQSTGSYQRQTRSISVKEESISNPSDSFHTAEGKKQNPRENSNMQNGSWTSVVLMNGENSVRPRKRMRNMRDLLTASATTTQEESRCPYEYKSGQQSPSDVASHLEDSEGLSFGSLSTEHPNWIRTMLMDVEVTVLANHRKEDVPFVSLMSRNGKAIIGHPIDIEALDDPPDAILVKKDRLKNEKNRMMNQLIWRTCKRTPVCYISNINAFPFKGEETEETCKISGDSNVRSRKGSPPTEKAPRKRQISAVFSKNDTGELCNAT